MKRGRSDRSIHELDNDDEDDDFSTPAVDPNTETETKETTAAKPSQKEANPAKKPAIRSLFSVALSGTRRQGSSITPSQTLRVDQGESSSKDEETPVAERDADEKERSVRSGFVPYAASKRGGAVVGGYRGRSYGSGASRSGLLSAQKVERVISVHEIVATEGGNLDFEFSHQDLELKPCHDAPRISQAGWVPESVVEKLWEQKSRIDSIFDRGLPYLYYKERDLLFPLDKKGSTNYWNRAGDKLIEVNQAAPFIKREGDSNDFYFADVCGGPGAWSQCVMMEEPFAVGFGMTLIGESVPTTDIWYPLLIDSPNFHRYDGIDGTGNVYNMDNIRGFEELILKHSPQGVHIVVADGGFEIPKNSTGEHLENIQELLSGRIIMSEIFCATLLLREGGSFVCKLYDCFSSFTMSLLYLCTQVFQQVHVVKPPHSRVVNSERYLVARGILARDNPTRMRVRSILEHLHQTVKDDQLPTACIPQQLMRENERFIESTRRMILDIAEKQTDGLRQVMDRAEEQAQLIPTRQKQYQNRGGASHGYRGSRGSRGFRR